MTLDEQIRRYRRGLRYKGRALYASRVGPRLSSRRRGAVAMFHVGRSGSTVLADLVGRHPMMFWDGEIYRKHLQANGLTFETMLTADPMIQPPNIETASAQSGPLFYGCEVKFFHLERFHQSLDDFLGCLEDNDFTSIVILRRKNTLAKVVSSLRASHSGTYNSERTSATVGGQELAPLSIPPVVEIDATAAPLVELLDGYERGFDELQTRLDQSRFELLHLTYEDDIRPDPTIAYRKMTSHLGLMPIPVRPRLQKLATGRPGYYDLANAHHVRQWLGGSGHEWMVDDLER